MLGAFALKKPLWCWMAVVLQWVGELGRWGGGGVGALVLNGSSLAVSEWTGGRGVAPLCSHQVDFITYISGPSYLKHHYQWKKSFVKGSLTFLLYIKASVFVIICWKMLGAFALQKHLWCWMAVVLQWVSELSGGRVGLRSHQQLDHTD